MADVTVSDVAAGTATQLASRGIVWVSSTVGYWIGIAGTPSGDIVYTKTTDGGQTWGAFVAIHAGTYVGGISLWYDNWTPGDTGGKIHICGFDTSGTDNLGYSRLDTSDDGVEVAGTSIVTGTVTAGVISVSKSRGGTLFVAAEDGDASLSVFYRSTDGGAAWTSRATPTEGAAGDTFELFPGNEVSSDAMWLIYDDISADELSLKVYSNTLDSWVETSIATGIVETARGNANPQFSASVRHSDNHLILVAWNDYDVTTADLLCWDINGALSITAKTNVISNSDDCFACGITINQNTDDLYVAYLGKSDGTETALATVTVYYKKSTDDGTNWGSETALSEDAADDFRTLHADLGGTNSRFYPVWYDDDDDDLFGNYTNSVEITSGGTVELAATCAASASTTATAVLLQALAATCVGAGSPTAVVNLLQAITGTVVVTSTVTGMPVVLLALNGTSAGLSAVIADLTVVNPAAFVDLAATISSASTLDSALVLLVAFVSTTDASSVLTGAPALLLALDGTILATTTVVGASQLQMGLSGTISSTGLHSGQVALLLALESVVANTVTLSSDLDVVLLLEVGGRRIRLSTAGDARRLMVRSQARHDFALAGDRRRTLGEVSE